MENLTHSKRFIKTIEFVNFHLKKDSSILDLGIKNKLSEMMSSQGYNIINTKGEDLDIDFKE